MNQSHNKTNTIFSDSKHLYPYQNESLTDMEGEIWKDLKKYESLYLVSDKGRVKQLANYKIYTDKIGRLYKRY